MERGKRCWRMSFSGCLRPDMVQLWRVCTVFFQNRAQLWRICALFLGFSFSLPVEAVFKGVQSMQITLAFVYLNRCMGLYHAHESGRYTALLLCILFLTRIPDAVGA